ncbi:hypothetical protein [Rhizobium leguminosarum]|uniref:hypothetical protein n=1 Tax=Rhizobium leguminosarum TaxID=384 RepID=UPI00103091A8|nr:hypothetical protein [Rhizobium leguminosarum]TAY13847.1 hypothetical protein ELH96_19745 [Rhizobium leguminosarum]
MGALQLILLRDDIGAIGKIRELGDDAIIAEPDHFEGGPEIISAVVQVTTVTLPILGLIIRERIKANRYVKVKVKGVEIVGASLDDVGKLLTDLEKK